MSAFHAALQQIAKPTSLEVKVEKKVYDCGTVGFKASFLPKEKSGFVTAILTVDFIATNEQARVTAAMEKFSLYNTASFLEQKIKQHKDAFEIATNLVNSEEIKHLLVEVTTEEALKVKAKYDQKIEKMKKTHTQLTEKTATELVEKTASTIRKIHAEKNADHTGRYLIDCKISLTTVTIHENCETKSNSVDAVLSKRIAYSVNNWGKTKQEVIETLTGSWVATDLALEVR